LSALQKQTDNALAQLHGNMQRIQGLSNETETVRRDIAVLRQQLAPR